MLFKFWIILYMKSPCFIPHGLMFIYRHPLVLPPYISDELFASPKHPVRSLRRIGLRVLELERRTRHMMCDMEPHQINFPPPKKKHQKLVLQKNHPSSNNKFGTQSWHIINTWHYGRRTPRLFQLFWIILFRFFRFLLFLFLNLCLGLALLTPVRDGLLCRGFQLFQRCVKTSANKKSDECFTQKEKRLSPKNISILQTCTYIFHPPTLAFRLHHVHQTSLIIFFHQKKQQKSSPMEDHFSLIRVFPKIVGKPPKWMVYNGKPY